MKTLLRLLGVVAASTTIIIILTGAASAQTRGVVGTWGGAIEVVGTQLTISVTFAMAESLTATIDIPQQGARDIPLVQVAATADSVRFAIQAGPGLAEFAGVQVGDSIGGSFTQSGVEGSFWMRRQVVDEEIEALPYYVDEVEFSNGSVTLAGTFTVPRDGGPYPAVVLVSGSGPQNREGDVFGFEMFKALADHLTRNGIAVLRYDDRGLGGSSGNLFESTTEDFAYDALAGVRLLTLRRDIDPTKIGIVGHSEGGTVAPIAAARSSGVAFIVLLAGTGVTGEELLVEQAELILRASGASDDELRDQRELQRRILRVAREDEGWEDVAEELMRLGRVQLGRLSEEARAAIPDPDTYLATQARASMENMRSRWFRFFMQYDPVPTLRTVDVPVLAMFGELDLQVAPHQNAGPIESALHEGGNEDVTVVTVPGANHLFQAAETGVPAEYARLEPEFIPGFLDAVTEWILAQTR
ncbi:MAG: alpha/beta hydrolase family protein [Gemmatimonadales bacterium]